MEYQTWQNRRNRRRRGVRRRPPAPFIDAPSGTCRLCGEATEGRRRWHPECLQVYGGSASAARAHLVALHGEVCFSCGHEGYGTHVDHIRPLWSLSDVERLEPRWWLPFNLQLLCWHCHGVKSGQENRERARLRKAAMAA